MAEFKVGDRIICLRSYGMTARLKRGKEYTIVDISERDEMIMLNDIDIWLADERFVLATDASRLLFKDSK